MGNALSVMRKTKVFSEELGLPLQKIELGPWPVGNNLGFQTAMKQADVQNEEYQGTQ